MSASVMKQQTPDAIELKTWNVLHSRFRTSDKELYVDHTLSDRILNKLYSFDAKGEKRRRRDVLKTILTHLQQPIDDDSYTQRVLCLQGVGFFLLMDIRNAIDKLNAKVSTKQPFFVYSASTEEQYQDDDCESLSGESGSSFIFLVTISTLAFEQIYDSSFCFVDHETSEENFFMVLESKMHEFCIVNANMTSTREADRKSFIDKLYKDMRKRKHEEFTICITGSFDRLPTELESNEVDKFLFSDEAIIDPYEDADSRYQLKAFFVLIADPGSVSASMRNDYVLPYVGCSRYCMRKTDLLLFRHFA